MSYQDFKSKFIGTIAATGYDGDQESVLIDAYVKQIENAWESAELRADKNYSDFHKEQAKYWACKEALESATRRADEYYTKLKKADREIERLKKIIEEK